MNSQSVLLGPKPALTSAHGGGVRGAVLSRRSPQFEGRFGRMFRTLAPAEFDLADLEALAAEGRMSADPEENGGKPSAALEDPATRVHDAEENTGIDAGYTYLGQFIDHDITFDPASSLQKVNDPDGLIDFRTPRLDLDCLYGRGPDDQPYMFTADGRKFLLGRHLTENGHQSHARDLVRFHWQEDSAGEQHSGGSNEFARALIGDKRNDENVIVSQLQSAMLQFHNRLVDDLGLNFTEIQRLVRWHYQWIVLNDYLPKIVGREMVESILPHLKSGRSIIEDKPKLQIYHYKEAPYIPIEFAAAAYRFGHSMVRPIYRLNTRLHGGEDPQQATAAEKSRGLEGRFFIFAGVGRRGLNGFREFPSQWAIDWSLFFNVGGSAANVGAKRVQPAYKIDTSLVNPLAFLPEFSEDTSPPLTLQTLRPPPKPNAIANLAERNLKRGLFMSLPTGQDIARAMGLEPIADEDLFVGKATFENAFADATAPADTANTRLIDVSTNFAGRAPLWYYVLAEALHGWREEVKRLGVTGDDADKVPTRLGPVGGRIVAETLIGLLLGDSYSFLNQHPRWEPTVPAHGAQFTVGDLLKYALKL